MGEATKRPHCDLCGHDHWRHEPHKWARGEKAPEPPLVRQDGEAVEQPRQAGVVSEKVALKPKKPRQRREYMTGYMAGYREKNRDKLRTYQRNYMRRRRQGGEHGK